MDSALALVPDPFESTVVKGALQAIEEHSINPDTLRKAIDLLNSSVNLSSYQTSFDNAFDSVAEIKAQLSKMRQRPNVPKTQNISPPGISNQDEINQLKDEINQLKGDIESLTNKAQLSVVSMEELKRRAGIDYILHRVHKKTHAHLLESSALIEELIPQLKPTKAFLLSIDIRRSTDLMLNAKGAVQFKDFLEVLSNGLERIIKEHFGVFDKFTGDGALAFFPEGFSGDGAATNVLLAAKRVHHLFAEHYQNSRPTFDLVLRDTGLGIGIDYGDVNIIRLSDGLTAVGRPVVFACRYSSAKAGTTLVNQGAYEMMIAADAALEFDEVPKSIKNQQGDYLAYRPKNSPRSELIKEPEWFSAGPAPTE